MSLILVLYFLLYGLMHFYLCLKIRYVYRFGIRTGIPFAIFMTAMIFTPVIVRLSEKAGYEYFARFAAYGGYTWMAALFMFFSISLCIDFCRLCVYVSGRILKVDFSPVLHAYKYFFAVPLICSLSIVVYGYHEAGQIKTERLIIKTNRIPEKIKSLKIVHVSDIHLGLIVGQSSLEKIAAEIRRIKPDILVSTGDIVDGQINHLDNLIDPLKNINPPYGKFAVTGNHEFYAGIEESLDFMRKAGFMVLRGRSTVAGGIINIVGVDDAGQMPNKYKAISDYVLLAGLHEGLFTILLKHRPIVDRAAIGLFNLQLSGHTHKGQIFPFNFITKLFFPMYNGFFKLSDDSFLYVSRGSGTWGPPIRFLAPPEITVIELIHASN
jgi:uncharacterized protein